MTHGAGSGPGPGGFRREEIGVGGDAQTERLTMLLDLQAAQPAVMRLRDWAFERLSPAPGDTVVEVGSGTGATTVRLAAGVGPTGSATGVEPNPALREVAARRADAVGSTAVFVDGVAEALPFEDRSVDVLVCERVLQHLEDPETAVRELARVVRTGGRVALLDSDWGTAITHPVDPEVHDRYRAFALSRWPNPFAGRRLRSQLRRAGLVVDPEVGSSALVMPDEALGEDGVVMATARAAADAGAITPDELHRLTTGLADAVDSGDAFVAVTMFGVIGRHPG